MKIEFFKMHGCGDDFICIDYIKNLVIPKDISTTAIKLCNRHFGIGGDGIVLILPSEVADCKIRIFNSDGSEESMCGNAIRCVAKYIYDKKYVENVNIKIETLNDIKNLSIEEHNNAISECKADMGKPLFNPKLIPAISTKELIINEKILIDNVVYYITCLFMGNPHCVVFVEDLENLDLNKIGPLFERNNRFPNRINVDFVKVLNNNEISIRAWERGSGETISSGTGACAAVVASILNNYCDYGTEIIVHLIGGILTVKYIKDYNVYLKGPAEFIYEGQIEMNE